MVDRLGQQFGSYRLERLLGKGGFAEVYLGTHVLLGTPAAIKILIPHLTGKEIEQLTDEAKKNAYLIHPNIVRILEFSIADDGTPFLVMDYAPRGTLRSRYPRGTLLPLPTVVTYVQQVASALQYAHDRKIIHRDVKPENMLLGQNDEVMLSDFGIATVAHSERSLRTQEAAGTVPYMAPEQIEGKPRPASDQYALGVVVYEWLSGERPFQGTQVEIIAQHLQTQPPSLDKKIATISSALSNVVMRALEKKPQDRFANVQEFAVALAEASSVSSVTQVPKAHTLPASFLPLLEDTQRITEASPSFGKPIFIYSGHSREITDMCWSPDGTCVATASLDGTTQIWNITTRESIFSSYFEDNNIYDWSYVNSIVWSPDGSYIATASSTGLIQIFGITDRKEYARCKLGTNSYGQRELANTLKWSPDGRYLAFRSFYSYPYQNSVKIWSMNDLESILSYDDHLAQILSFQWSLDGRHIASSAKSVHIWDAATTGRIFIFHDSAAWVNSISWSPDGRYIASGGDDKTVQIWDAVVGENVYIYLGHKRFWGGQVSIVTWSPDGQNIASVSGKKIHVWDVMTGETIIIYEGHSDRIRSVAWSPDGRYIASIANTNTEVHVWDANTGNNICYYSKHSGIVEDIAWSPDGTKIASRSTDKTVQIWQAS